MIGVVLVILLILYFLGYIRIPGIIIPNLSLFNFNGHPVTLINLLVFLVIIWAIGVLPSPLRQIAMLLILFWVLSELGILAITGLSNIIVILVIVGLIISLF